MAQTKKDNTDAESAQTAQSVEADNAEVQRKMDEATERGYIGSVPDPISNREYSLLSGPDAPPLVPDNETRVEQSSAVKGTK